MSALETLVGRMTVEQLAEATGLTLDELVGSVMARARTNDKKKVRGASHGDGRDPLPPRSGEIIVRASGHETRTATGRETLDSAILDFLRAVNGPVAAAQIREATGGTAAQIRARLNYLIEHEGTVDYTGQARGTRYWAR